MTAIVLGQRLLANGVNTRPGLATQ